MNLDTIILYLAIAAFPTIVVAAAVYQYMEVARAALWPKAIGRILVSTTEARRVATPGANIDDTEVRTFAKIVYEFTVAGRKYRSGRVVLGEYLENISVAETIAKYPAGADVTVYYNPMKPSECVLERNMPPGMMRGFMVILIVLAAIITGGVIVYRHRNDLAGLIASSGVSPFAMVFGGFATLSALIVWGIQRSFTQQRAWPTVQGRVEKSDVREFQEFERRDKGPGRWRTAYRADVIYSYDVRGVRYTGDMSSGMRISSNIKSFARKRAAKYPEGATVKVHYNPANPGESAIDLSFGWLALLWLLPAALTAAAYFAVRWQGSAG